MQYYEPISILEEIEGNSEMTYEQLGFLCGLIKERSPKKIVEVGVASGGTTAVILNAIKILGLSTQMVSVDKMKRFYRDTDKNTGFMAEQFQRIYPGQVVWEKMTGYILPQVIESIGKDIDILVLDTMHILPGECLDFLVALPFLASNAIVVLHDIAFHHIGKNKDAYATQVLLNSVVAERIEPIECKEICGYPNIGAFIINKDTRKYIANVFGTLRLTWKYMVSKEEAKLYLDFYQRFYGEEYAIIMEQAYAMNEKTLVAYRKGEVRKEMAILSFFSNLKGKKIVIYGYGNYGKKVEFILQKCEMPIYRIVVSNAVTINTNQNKIVHIGEIAEELGECFVVVAVGKQYQGEIVEELKKIKNTIYCLLEDEVIAYLDDWSESDLCN